MSSFRAQFDYMSVYNSLPIDAVGILNILTATPEATAVYVSRDLHIGYINQAMLNLWNKKDNITGRLLLEAAPEFTEFLTLLQQVWDSGKAYHATNTLAIIDIDGERIAQPFDFIYQPVMNDEGKTYAIINTATNVSAREETKRIVAKKERDNQEVNDRLLQTNEEYKAGNDQLQQLNEEYQAINEELNATLEDVALLNSQLNVANDNLKVLNSELNNNRARLNNALQAADLGSYDLELATGLMECSDQCKTNFGRDLSARFDFPDLLQTILPDYRDQVAKAVAFSLEKQLPYNAEYQIKRPDGSIHWIQANGTPIYNENGTAIQLVGVTQLITEKKQYQIRKDEFLSVASHELKTPITVLKANLQLLERLKSKINNTIATKLIDTCNRSVNKLSDMMNELLDMGKYTEGIIDLNETIFDLRELINNSCQFLATEDLLKIHIDAETVLIKGDENRIEQVLVNFITNAFKYAPESKEIAITVQQQDQEVRVSVIDQGAGIPTSELPRLFDRYWQADKKQKNENGLGLGLYICAEIITKHQGQIGADSVLGKGSTFWFSLPLSK